MEPIKVARQSWKEIENAIEPILSEGYMSRITPDQVQSAADLAEESLDKILLPKTYRPGARFVSNPVVSGYFESRLLVKLRRHSSAWYLYEIQRYPNGETIFEGRDGFTLFLLPKQARSSFLDTKDCKSVIPGLDQINVMHASVDEREIVKIVRRHDKTTNTVHYHVLFDDPIYRLVIAVVPSVEGITTVLPVQSLSRANPRALDASKYDGWLRVQISKWEAKRK